MMKHFNKTLTLKFIFLFCLSFTSMSCGEGESESAIAKKITLTISKGAIVLQNKLSDVYGQTCVSGGVTGPRVRMRSSIAWSGEGDLLPLAIMISSSDRRLAAEMSGTISPGEAGSESLAFMFGLTTDYIPSDGVAYPMTDCFLDYGGLPRPIQKVTGANTLEVPVTIQVTGVVRDSNGDDTPFVKEVSSTIIYVAGSVP